MFMKPSIKIKKLFHFSNYRKDSKFYNNSNNLVVGKMRNETCGLPIRGFVGLKSKIYTLITEEKHESKKAKNINKNVIDDELKYEDCKNVLFNKSYMRNEMNRIQYKDHNIGSYRTHDVYLRS